MTDILVSYLTGGDRRWTMLPDLDALRTFATDPRPVPDRGEIHLCHRERPGARLFRRGFYTTLQAVLDAPAGYDPAAIEGTMLERADARGGERSRILVDLKSRLRMAADIGVIDQGQAAFIARTTAMAMLDVGPAGRRPASPGTRIFHRDGQP